MKWYGTTYSKVGVYHFGTAYYYKHAIIIGDILRKTQLFSVETVTFLCICKPYMRSFANATT